jgi:hypothetical protein
MEPMYLKVDRVGVPVRVLATIYCSRPHLVRVLAAHYANKLALIPDSAPVELRTCTQSQVTLELPPRDGVYWLSIFVFSQDHDGWWSRCLPDRNGQLGLPQHGLGFSHRGSRPGNYSVTLDLTNP